LLNNNSLNEGIIAIIDNLEGYCSIYNETGKFLGNIELNETVNFNQPITFSEIISSTGLQIKTDPGIPIIYLGIFLFNVKYLNKLYNIFTNLDYSKKSKTFYWWNNKSSYF
jgi:hypothetical protein